MQGFSSTKTSTSFTDMRKLRINIKTLYKHLTRSWLIFDFSPVIKRIVFKYWNIKKESTRSPITLASTLYQDYFHRIANVDVCATVQNIFSDEIISNNPKCRKRKCRKCWSSYKTLESTDEMKLLMTFYLCLHNFSDLWKCFLGFPWEIVSGVIQSGKYLYI